MKTQTVRLSDVAKAAGVSRGTASNAFNHPEIVRPKVREKVLAAAAALGYAGPDPRGRMLRAGKVNAIGVATAEPLAYFFEDPFARVVMSGIAQACDETGAGISLVSAANEEHLAWNIQNALVDGFVVFCIEGGSRLVELTRERRLPFVTLDYGFDDDTVSSIGIDDVDGATRAARHLTGLGHRRFAILSLASVDGRTGPATPANAEAAVYSGTRDRMRGYLSAIADAGIAPESVSIFETDNDEPSTRRALDHIFAQPERPTAILAMSDRMALTALDWLAEHGLSVPQDVSVVGFDGVPESETSRPPLTTVAQPMIEMGRRAVSAILDFDGSVRREALDLELVVRQSTAPPPCG